MARVGRYAFVVLILAIGTTSIYCGASGSGGSCLTYPDFYQLLTRECGGLSGSAVSACQNRVYDANIYQLCSYQTYAYYYRQGSGSGPDGGSSGSGPDGGGSGVDAGSSQPSPIRVDASVGLPSSGDW